MTLKIKIFCVDPTELDAHMGALGWMRNPTAALGERKIGKSSDLAAPYGKRPTVSELETLLRSDDGPAVHINPDGSVVVAGTPAEASPAAPSEFAALERPDDLKPTGAEIVNGRVRGQPSPGKKRRTPQEVAEDTAWEANRPATAPLAYAAPAISTGEPRVDPNAAADEADEAAETAAARAARPATGELVFEDVRVAVSRWMPTVQAKDWPRLMREIVGQPLDALEKTGDKASWAKAIDNLDWAAANPGVKVLGVPGGASELDGKASGVISGTVASGRKGVETVDTLIAPATQDDVKRALLAYGRRYDVSENPKEMTNLQTDGKLIINSVFGGDIFKISEIPDTPEAYGRVVAAIRKATTENTYKREVVRS